MSEIIEMARKYRAIGWQVIPLFNYSKNPAPLRWKDWQDKMLTEEEFSELFARPNLTGLGILTGHLSGIVVLDEDTYKEGGKKVAVATGMMARSARGGKHHFFKYVEPIKSSGLRDGIFVEIKADGGFLVLPPSKVKIDDGSIGEYSWEDKCMPDEMMEIRESMLTEYRSGAGDGKAVDMLTLVHAPLGSQHNNLRSVTLAILNRFNEREWDIAQEVIRQMAKNFDPPHPPERVEKMIRDCMIFVKQHPKEVEDEVANVGIQPQSINAHAEDRWQEKLLEKAAPSFGWPELDAHVGGAVPGHVMTFTGDTNVGKTTIACNWADALRRQGKKTLYVALEPDTTLLDYLATIRLRKPFRDLTESDLRSDDDLIHMFRQDDIKSPAELLRSLRSIKDHYDLIIIDHIGYFVTEEKNWLQRQANVVKELKVIAKEFMSCVIMIAHLRKPTQTAKNKEWIPTQNDISGSAAFKQDSQEVLIAYRPVIEGSFGTKFSDEGRLLITKTKSEGGNGTLTILFVKGTAKVWSLDEVANDPEGLKEVQYTFRNTEKMNWEYNMAKTEKFDGYKEETDTGSEDV